MGARGFDLSLEILARHSQKLHINLCSKMTFMSSLKDAVADISAGRFAAALEKLERIISQGDSSWRPQLLMAIVSAELGDAALAAQFYSTCIALNQDLANFRFEDGLLKQVGKYTESSAMKMLWHNYHKITEADALIISYPKCGRTWLRMQLSKALTESFRLDLTDTVTLEVERFPEFDGGIPRIEFSHDDNPHWKLTQDVVTDKAAYRDKTVILLLRDPRDVIVSYYFQYTKRGDKKIANDVNFAGSVDDFAFHKIGGLANIVRFYNVWCAAAKTMPGVMLVRYEDMHSRPLDTLRAIIDHIGLSNIGDAHLQTAVDYCEFDKMRRYEETNKFKNARLYNDQSSDPEALKTRKGVIGGYREYLSDESVRRINAYLADNLSEQLWFYK